MTASQVRRVVVLSILAVRTGRLGPGILAHATFNLFTVIYLAATR